ncbi:MAG: hypothetical protein KJ734_05845, partial [Chloroflexi bacterium]|nr:hypothetical protein [Chloroflexota bacterium]
RLQGPGIAHSPQALWVMAFSGHTATQGALTHWEHVTGMFRCRWWFRWTVTRDRAGFTAPWCCHEHHCSQSRQPVHR